MAGLSTNAPGLWGGFAGLLYGSTSLSTPPGLLADATPAWVLPGAALDLDFADGLGYNSRNLATTTPDSILTYTAPSPKLVYGDDGVLGYAPHNLLTYSEQFDNAAWVKAQATVTADAAVAPDGTTTADALLDTAANNIHYIAHSISGLSPAGRTFTMSAYLKKSTLDYATVGIADVSSGTLYAVAVFNLNTGAVATSGAAGTGYSVVSSSSTSVGNGWYRCVVTAVAGTSVTFLRAVVGLSKNGLISAGAAGFESYLGNGSGFFVWGAQCAFGSSALTYIPTTTAAVYSLPIDHNPTTFEPLGVLIEEQRVNLLTYSEQFDNAAWTKSACSVTGNAAVAPDGTTTADLVTNTSVGGVHSITATIATVALVAHSASVYVKKGNNASVKVEAFGTAFSPTYAAIEYNFDTDTITPTVGTATRALLSNGWVRITANFTASNTGCLVRLRAGPGNGADDATVYVWGAQLEAGAFPTSYIPTVASQVTRLADQVSILTSAFAYNAVEGAVYQEIRCAVEGSGSWGFTDYSSATNFFGWIRSGGNGWIFRSGAGSGTLRAFDTNTGYVVGNSVKMAASYVDDLGNFQSVNGQTVVNNGPVDPDPRIPTSFNFGRPGFLSAQHIKRLTYFPVRKTNAELVVLST